MLDWPALEDIARIIRYDARGHGLSGVAGADADYSWSSLANTLWQVADAYQVESAVVGGGIDGLRHCAACCLPATGPGARPVTCHSADRMGAAPP